MLYAVSLFRDKGKVVKHLFNGVTILLRLHTCLQFLSFIIRQIKDGALRLQS